MAPEPLFADICFTSIINCHTCHKKTQFFFKQSLYLQHINLIISQCRPVFCLFNFKTFQCHCNILCLVASERILGIHGSLGATFLSRHSSSDQATLLLIYSALSQIGESIPVGQPAGDCPCFQNHSPGLLLLLPLVKE